MSRRKKIWLIGGSLVTAAAAGTIIFLLHWAQTGTEGTVHVGESNAAVPAPQPIPLKTSFFTTVLPPGFSVKRQVESPASDPQLELEANTPSATDEQIAISAGPLPGGGIAGLGDYNLRRSQPAAYQPFSPASLPAGAAGFRTTGGPTSFVSFWPHEGRYYEIALSTGGVSALSQLDAVFTQVMSSWKWTQ